MTKGSIQIPEGAQGREGMLVALRKVKGLEPGRLAIVKHAVGWVGDLLGSKRQVFAWQVLLTGEPTSVHGRLTQEIIVADACLVPVSQLAQEDAQALVARHEQNKVEEAAAQVRALVAPEDMDSPEMDKALHQAFSQAFLNHALEIVGVEQTLLELGFWLSHPDDSETIEWKSVFNGQEIRMGAGLGMFEDWKIWVGSANAREICWDERVVLNEWPRGRIAQVVLELWEGVFGSSKIPKHFDLGWFYRQHQQDMRSMKPGLPRVSLDGDELRRALRWLREAYAADDFLVGPSPDVVLALEIKSGELRFRTEQFDIGVSVRRGWIDACAVSLRTLLMVPSAWVRGAWVTLEYSGREVVLGGHVSPVVPSTESQDQPSP